MTKQLQILPFLFLVFTALNVTSQEIIVNIDHNNGNHEVVTVEEQNAVENVNFLTLEEFSDKKGNCVAGLQEIISSDENADFNCSAGFCMNRKHHHKKGLTRNRQLFNYFLDIDG